MADQRTQHAATVLADGRVLVTGGFLVDDPFARWSAELFEPASRAWVPAQRMATERYQHTATTLADGRVLVAAGLAASAEIYDPGTNSWSPAGAMTVAPGRAGHTANLLADGRVLVSAGIDGAERLASTQLYDPTTNGWIVAGDLLEARDQHASCALSDGRIMVAGGLLVCPGPPNPNVYTKGVELFDPSTGAWAPTQSLSFARGGPTASVLPSGAVLVAGGECMDCAGHEASAELFQLELGDPCAQSGQCASGQCVTGVCCSVGDCGGYACGPEGTCLQSCGWSGDCIAGLVCDSEGRCVTAGAAGEDGCGCRVGPAGRWRAIGLGGTVPGLLLVLAWRRRALRRRGRGLAAGGSSR
jgi:hypothetical protein